MKHKYQVDYGEREAETPPSHYVNYSHRAERVNGVDTESNPNKRPQAKHSCHTFSDLSKICYYVQIENLQYFRG